MSVYVYAMQRCFLLLAILLKLPNYTYITHRDVNIYLTQCISHFTPLKPPQRSEANSDATRPSCERELRLVDWVNVAPPHAQYDQTYAIAPFFHYVIVTLGAI